MSLRSTTLITLAALASLGIASPAPAANDGSAASAAAVLGATASPPVAAGRTPVVTQDEGGLTTGSIHRRSAPGRRLQHR